jgi:hypothetical protein
MGRTVADDSLHVFEAGDLAVEINRTMARVSEVSCPATYSGSGRKSSEQSARTKDAPARPTSSAVATGVFAGDDHFVAFSDSDPAKGEPLRGGAIRHPDAGSDAAEAGVLLLEPLDLGFEHARGCLDHRVDRMSDSIRDMPALQAEVHHRDGPCRRCAGRSGQVDLRHEFTHSLLPAPERCLS